MEKMREFSVRLGRSLALVLCAVLAVYVVLAMTSFNNPKLLFPRPLKWYAAQAAEAVRTFAAVLFAPPAGQNGEKEADVSHKERKD